MGFTLAIVGRPNVGKSTLFNRLTGERDAIVDDQSGVTRDRKYGMSFWNGKTFNVIDTGGFVANSNDIFESAIRSQVSIAIDEASLVLFIVDVTTGITDLDEEVARMLRKSDKGVILVVNKVDNHERQLAANEFYSLGFEHTYFIASISGTGTGDLLDAVDSFVPEEAEEVQNALPRVAIVGQPNVGKSSLVNALMGEERNIVTDIAGTTRDTTFGVYNRFNKKFELVDTAGIRKKGKVHENLEFYSVMRAINAIDKADVVILVIDATLGLEAQDLNIFRLAYKKKKGILIFVNKWDLIKKETQTAKEFTDRIHAKTAPFTDIPVIFISALEKTRIFKGVELAMEVYDRRNTKIPTAQLNDVMLAAINKNPPPAIKGKYVKIKYITQLPTSTPSFAFFCNLPKYIKDPYKHFLENKLREAFPLGGVPISIYLRQK